MPEEDLTTSYEFTLIEIHGAAVLVMDGNDTSVHTGDVVGDDTGALHVGPFQTLALTKVSELFVQGFAKITNTQFHTS